MFGPILVTILASIGVLALVGYSTRRQSQLPSNRLATYLTASILLGLIAALLLSRGAWVFAIPLAAGAIACAQHYLKLSAQGKNNARSLAQQGEMSAAEARAILGVSETATSEDIKAAHRKLIDQVHPDKGGNDYLAAQINRARDTLLKGMA